MKTIILNIFSLHLLFYAKKFFLDATPIHIKCYFHVETEKKKLIVKESKIKIKRIIRLDFLRQSFFSS